MRNLFCLLFLCLAVFLTACTGERVTSGSADSNSSGSTIVQEENGNITSKASEILIETPMTISNNMIKFKGEDAFLRLKMVSGKYYEDWGPGAITGTIYEGKFILELSDALGKTITHTDLGTFYTQPLTFTGDFKLEFDDYNNDGNMDFTIGQYASSNGRTYKLFGLKPDGSIENIRIKDTPELFLSDSAGFYSTRLQKQNSTAFKARFYDNRQGKNFESVYEWQGSEFVKVSSREILPLEGFYEIMSDMSISPDTMISYIKKNIGNASDGDAADLLLRLELLQKNYLNSLANRYNNEDMQRKLGQLYSDGVINNVNVDDIKDYDLKELLSDVKDNGFKTAAAEGDLFPIIDYSIYREFVSCLPEDLGSYFALMAVESDQKPASDGGLVISWDEVIKRALAQEQFILNYSSSQKLDEVKVLYGNYISFIFNGLPNTPDFTYETKTLNPKLKQSLSKAVQINVDSQLKKTISEYLDILSKNGYKLTDEVDKFRKNAVAESCV